MAGFSPFKFIGFVIFTFGVVIAIYGFSFLMQTNDLSKNGIKVKGKVVDISNNYNYRSPIVEYKTREGKKVTFISRLELMSQMFTYQKGQEVDVLYHKDNPLNQGKEKNAEIDAFWEQNMPQIFLGCFGFFLMMLGTILFLKGRKTV